jgi:hypothetical protein
MSTAESTATLLLALAVESLAAVLDFWGKVS